MNGLISESPGTSDDDGSAGTPVAIVTGAGSGIGRAVAVALLRNGYKVVLAGRRLEPLVATIGIADGFQDDAIAQITDCRDAASVAHLFSICRTQFGRLDLLFNNAGVSASAVGLENLSLEAWNKVIDTNITGYFLCIQEAFRMMSEQSPQGGRIINNGSIASIAPRPNSMPYAVSKHAITGMTKAAILDGRKYDIACSQIDIGNAASDMSVGFSIGTEQADGSIRSEPTIDAVHVADAVLQIAALPLHTNIPFMIVMPTKMPLFGRG